jgi:hypothetical protein
MRKISLFEAAVYYVALSFLAIGNYLNAETDLKKGLSLTALIIFTVFFWGGLIFRKKDK